MGFLVHIDVPWPVAGDPGDMRPFGRRRPCGLESRPPTDGSAARGAHMPTDRFGYPVRVVEPPRYPPHEPARAHDRCADPQKFS
jgi:hypothetical protein